MAGRAGGAAVGAAGVGDGARVAGAAAAKASIDVRTQPDILPAVTRVHASARSSICTDVPLVRVPTIAASMDALRRTFSRSTVTVAFSWASATPALVTSAAIDSHVRTA